MAEKDRKIINWAETKDLRSGEMDIKLIILYNNLLFKMKITLKFIKKFLGNSIILPKLTDSLVLLK